MRIARVLMSDSTHARTALVRDGVAYDVLALAEAANAPMIHDPLDFHAHAIALGGAGLEDLDGRLALGWRPSAARLAPSEFTWQPPCEPGRAACVLVHLEPDGVGYALVSARRILGHGAVVPARSGELVELWLGILLGEPLRSATASEAQRALGGLTVALRCGDPLDEERATEALAARMLLGPALVVPCDDERLGAARARLEVGADTWAAEGLGETLPRVAEALARISRDVDLEPGDVVLAGPLASARAVAGQRVVGAIEGVGALEGLLVASFE